MIDDRNIVMLRHHYKNLPLHSKFYKDQCDDLGILEKRHPEEKIGAKSRDWHGGSAGVPSAM